MCDKCYSKREEDKMYEVIEAIIEDVRNQSNLNRLFGWGVTNSLCNLLFKNLIRTGDIDLIKQIHDDYYEHLESLIRTN
jgi:hypothetical protein